MKSMRAIFYAIGPDIRPGAKVRPFENVDVYPFIAKILGLEIGPIDGQLKPLQGILRRPGQSGQALPQGKGAVARNFRCAMIAMSADDHNRDSARERS